MTKTRIYCLRGTSGAASLIRAASPAAAIRHWADSMLESIQSASQEDIVEVLGDGGTVETVGESDRDFDAMIQSMAKVHQAASPDPLHWPRGSEGEPIAA
jgi:hypothetical protein